jgi:hypothetical protein
MRCLLCSTLTDSPGGVCGLCTARAIRRIEDAASGTVGAGEAVAVPEAAVGTGERLTDRPAAAPPRRPPVPVKPPVVITGQLPCVGCRVGVAVDEEQERLARKIRCPWTVCAACRGVLAEVDGRGP